MGKWLLLLVIYGVLIYTGFLHKELVIDWIYETSSAEIPLMLFLSAFLSVFPVVPFTMFAGVMGIKFGIVVGMLINWFGGITAAAMFFLLARLGFQEAFHQKSAAYKKLHEFNQMFEQNSFFAVLLARMLTFFPPPVVNVYSGLSRMSFWAFILATGLGTIPGMFFLAFSGHQLVQSLKFFMLGVGAYLLFIALIFFIYRKWMRAREKAMAEWE